MGAAVGSSLPYAIAIVLSAAPILVMAVVLATTRPPRVSGMFVLGWAAGIAVVAAIIVGVVDTSTPTRRLSPETASTIRIALGVIVGVLALRSWRARAGTEDVPPRWIASVAQWSPRRALAIGFALGSINPKNLALVGAGAAAILRASALPRDQAIAVVIFAMVASLGIAAPFALQTFGNATTRRRLGRARSWLEARGTLLSSIILTAIAVVLIVQGLRG